LRAAVLNTVILSRILHKTGRRAAGNDDRDKVERGLMRREDTRRIKVGFGVVGDLPAALLCDMLAIAPSVAFYVKDAGFRYACGNAAMLDLCGVQHGFDFIGRSSRDFFPNTDASRYEASDQLILQTARPTSDCLRYTQRLHGRAVWLLCRRWPVIDKNGAVSGIAALARVLDPPQKHQSLYRSLAEATDYIHAHVRESLSVSEIARRVGLSLDRMEREFSAVFGMGPRDYISKARFEVAVERLASNESIAEVAHSCGYSDQSAFTRRFKQMTGMSPTEYRRDVLKKSQVM
jgi:AraC-like DNA-binding protein